MPSACLSIYDEHNIDLFIVHTFNKLVLSQIFSLCVAVFLDGATQDSCSPESEESKLPLQLAIVGRPNVGKSTLLNTLLQQERVLVGPEAGLTRDSIRAQFQYDRRTVYLVGCTLLLLIVVITYS